MDTGDHKPQIALYMLSSLSFKPPEHINTFSSATHASITATSFAKVFERRFPIASFLSFTLADQENFLILPCRQYPVPRGTDSEGREILYGSDKDLIVTRALLTTLRTLRVIHGKLLLQEPDSPLVVSRVFSSEIVVPDASTMQSAWATFGETRVGRLRPK